jgi:hypothetical protein
VRGRRTEQPLAVERSDRRQRARLVDRDQGLARELDRRRRGTLAELGMERERATQARDQVVETWRRGAVTALMSIASASGQSSTSARG